MKTNIIYMLICISILILIFTGNLFADWKIRKWDNNEWWERDKEVHYCAGWIVNNQLDKYNSILKTFLIGQVISLLYETKDGFYPWGFCRQDHIVFTIGQISQIIFDHIIFKKTIYSNNQLKKQLKKRLNKKLYR